MTREELKRHIKENIIKYLNYLSITPDEIEDDMPLFGNGLGLDSIDSIELVVMMEREYGVKIENPKEGRKILANINSIADCIEAHRAAKSQP
jgi:acyl carrier protein